MFCFEFLFMFFVTFFLFFNIQVPPAWTKKAPLLAHGPQTYQKSHEPKGLAQVACAIVHVFEKVLPTISQWFWLSSFQKSLQVLAREVQGMSAAT